MVPRPLHLAASSAAALTAAIALGACGTKTIDVPENSPQRAGAVLFSQRCSGCHTLSHAATYGSATNIHSRERNDGPNFNVRKENPLRVLYAIENGGFSGAIMPQNIVTGPDAQAVADFVAKSSGGQSPRPIGPGQSPAGQQPGGASGGAPNPAKSGQAPPGQTGGNGAANGSSSGSAPGGGGGTPGG